MTPAFRAHDPGPGHPERPERYDAVAAAVTASGADVVEPRPASPEALERIHDPRLLELMRRSCESGGGAIDPDTVVGPPSFDVARLASGAAVAAVNAVLDGEIYTAFCAGRPPAITRSRAGRWASASSITSPSRRLMPAGAESSRSRSELGRPPRQRHPGSVLARPIGALRLAHQFPHYPRHGPGPERGDGAGEGTTLNLPLAAGTTEELFLATFRAAALPAVQAFDPGLLLVSAGFDAHRDDPLCGLNLSAAAFGTMTKELADSAPARSMCSRAATTWPPSNRVSGRCSQPGDEPGAAAVLSRTLTRR